MVRHDRRHHSPPPDCWDGDTFVGWEVLVELMDAYDVSGAKVIARLNTATCGGAVAFGPRAGVDQDD